MGTVIHICGYKKNKEYISGEIKTLGWYEVNTNIDGSQSRIGRSETHINYQLHIFTLALEAYPSLGLTGPSDVSFIFNISDSIGGGYRVENGNTYVVMYDAARLLNVAELLLHNIGEIRLEPEVRNMEKENLGYLIDSLRIIAEEDGMVWMNWS